MTLEWPLGTSKPTAEVSVFCHPPPFSRTSSFSIPRAVFLRKLAAPGVQPQALLGMDLVRLGLERQNSALAAVEEICALIEKFGIGGEAGYQHHLVYHNGFIVCDCDEAIRVHTAGREWIYQRIRGEDVGGEEGDEIERGENQSVGIVTMSNAPSIGPDYTKCSAGFRAQAIRLGWTTAADFDARRFDFRSVPDRIVTPFAQGFQRKACTGSYLRENVGNITVSTVMEALRQHTPGHTGKSGSFDPAKGLVGQGVCMHAAMPPVRISQTTGSLVVHLRRGLPTQVWATGTAAPCTGVFKPMWMDALPESHSVGPSASGRDDAGASLFWEHELLHRETIVDYLPRMQAFRADRDELERSFLARVAKAEAGWAGSETRDSNRGEAELSSSSTADRSVLANLCMVEARTSTREWTKRVQALEVSRAPPLFFSLFWAWHNHDAQLTSRPLEPSVVAMRLLLFLTSFVVSAALVYLWL
jgi:secernin